MIHPIPLGKVDSMKASTSAPPVEYHSDFESREETFKKALKALGPDHKSHMIALCGMGGVGKTTMMEKLKTVVTEKRMFNLIVEVVIGEKTDPFAIQDAVADYLPIDLKERTIPARADKLRGWFKNYSEGGKNKILVTLDDVWEPLDLNDIGLSPLPDQGVDFKVLLTSRKRDACTRMGVVANSIFDVNVLENAEAQRFFWKFIADSGEALLDPDLSKLGDDIERRCQGLPIMIKTIAITLKGKSKGVWEDTLTRLPHHDINEIMNEIFELSYKNLEDDMTKSVFLLCGLYPEDFDIPTEELVRYGWGLKLFNKVSSIGQARNRLTTCIEQLVDANLLIESNRSGSIKMHNLVHDFVLLMYSKDEHASIVNHGNMSWWPRNNTPELCKRISVACNSLKEFPADFKYPNLSYLKLTNGEKSLKFPKKFYGFMEKLQVIVYEKMQYPLLPRSFEYSTNLRTLCLHECSLPFDCHSIGNLSNLEVLSFANCSIKKLPSPVGNLKMLKLLDLTGCVNLRIDDGVLKNLVKLEELYMRVVGRKAISFTDGNFNELAESSKYLSAIEIELFGNNVHPKRMSFINLERFKISIGRFLEKKDEKTTSFENTLMLISNKGGLLESGINELFKKTDVLHLEVDDMVVLEDFKCFSFHRLRVLNISGCEQLRYLFTRRVAFTLSRLEHLKVKSCDTLQTLIHDEDTGSETIRFPSLKFLSLGGLPKLAGLCNTGSVIELPRLTEITLKNCRSIKYLCSSQMFEYLKHVKIIECEVIEEIVTYRYDEDEEMATFTSTHRNVTFSPILETLKLRKLKSLQDISGDCCNSIYNQFQGSLCQYSRHIEIVDCDALSSAISSNAIGHMQHLVELEIYDCYSMKDVFEIKRVVNDVRSSVVPSLTNSTTTFLPDLRNLRKLIISGCPRLRDVFPFSTVKSLTRLEYLSILSCNDIRVIVKEEGEDGNHTTSSSDDQVVVFPCLKSLILTDLPNLESFFLGTKAFQCPVLVRVVIQECPKMKMFAQGHSDSPMLKYVHSNNYLQEEADKTKIPSNALEHMQHLEELEIRGCESMKDVFEIKRVYTMILPDLRNLRKLVIFACPLLKDVFPFSTLKSLTKLQHLKVEGCYNIQVIVKEEEDGNYETSHQVVDFPCLKSLELSRLPSLESFSLGMNDFLWPVLDTVKIKRCPKMRMFTKGHSEYPKLKYLPSDNYLLEEGLLRAVSKATNHYHDRNIIKDGESGKLYKGELSRDGRLMYIAVWRLNRHYIKNYIDDFRREIEFLSAFKHDNMINISSIFAYLDEDDENIIIYEHAFHGNLQGHLRNPALTWSRRLQICLGVARALNYIHNMGLIHCDINSSKILLDEDWKPKIFGFELCREFFPNWTHRLQLSRNSDSTSVMTPKDDIYLFGVLLFEVLCGKKPMLDEDGFNGKLADIIDPSLRIQVKRQSTNLFTNIAYSCLDKKLVERPSMKQIVKELEEALELQPEQENLERSPDREGALREWKRWPLEVLEIPLSEIMSATNNFDEACLVGSGGFGMVYRAELDVLDIQSMSSIKGKSKNELPRKTKTVAIKRLSKNRGKLKLAEEGFLAEIELPSSCKHPNVVSLLGFSREANERILVYEYALKGSLSNYLLGRERSLTWSQRIQICLHVAHGINYLHTNTEGKPRIIHRDIKSDNILLDENLNAKVADFGLSRFHLTLGEKSTIVTQIIVGTELYLDPEYRKTGKYKRESDIYSFGVVLFEVLSGKMAYDLTYTRENENGLAHIVRRRFNEGTLMELIDPKMLEDDVQTFTLNGGPTKDSFNLFSKIGYECLAMTQAERPKMEVVIETLEVALKVQGETMVLSRFRLSSIELATQNFDKSYYMESDTYGDEVYKAQLDHFESNSLLATKGKNNGEPSKRPINVLIKRILSRENEHGEKGFFSEIEMHTRYNHPNIVPLLGICYEGDNMLLVYEHASNESLDKYLGDTDNMTKYTWIQRLHLCLGIAHGLNHLHNLMEQGKQEMKHVDIRSSNILLGKSGEAKIAYSGFSKLLPTYQEASTNTTNNNVRTKVYCYPESRMMTHKLKKRSDIYSFGVVLFEIFCGRLAYDPVYTDKNDYGLAPIAHQCFSDRTIKEMIDPALKEESLEDMLTLNREPDLDSLGTYLRIANQCLAENQARRPTVQNIIEELEIALKIQETFIKPVKISFKDIESATGNFSQTNYFGSGRYWKAYKGELRHYNSNANIASASASGGGSNASDSVGPSSSAGPTASEANTKKDFIVAKRWDSKSNQGDHQFRTELSIIIKCKHENIIGLVGYCQEMDERIIVYEQASKGSLDMYLNDATLTWVKRLKICMDVARALAFLHGGDGMLKKVVHRNIQSTAILLNDDWKAKISNFEMSSLDSLQQDMEHVSNNAYGGFGYLEPEYKQGYVTEKSDMYSFGVVMFEILCGSLAWSEGFEDQSKSLGPLAKRHYEEGKLDELVFKDIKKQIDTDAMAIYADIAYECLHDIRDKRPTAGDVILQLKKALDLQGFKL